MFQTMIILRDYKFNLFVPKSCTLLILACLWSLAGFGALAGCPKVCECKWRDGKQVVACQKAHFIDIPRGLEPSTQVLDLRHNNLRILPKDSFGYSGLVNLQKVWLSFCNLMRVEDGAFRGLENVVEIDLSNNFLKSVPTNALMDMGGLRELRIAHNSISIISSTAFLPTPELVQLDISHNNIATIEEGALRHLIYLEVLDISENKMITLTAKDVIPLTVLRVMNLDGNPWHCDCHLKALRKWLVDYEVTPTIPPACTHPRWLMGELWQLLDLNEFVCTPEVSAAAPRVLASEGENVTLVCQVKSEVETSISWLIGDNMIQNSNESLRHYVYETAIPDLNSYISNLTITGVVPEDQGTYRCIAENRAGFREVNLTLQVSHEVAEVRIANVEPTTYVKSGLVMGISVVIFIVLILCSLIYCKLRTSHSRQQEDEKSDVTQNSRSSDSDTHNQSGYHIVPTNEFDDQPKRRNPSQQQPWMERRTGNDSDGNVGTPHSEKRSGHPQNQTQTISCPTTTPSSVSYVEIPKSGVGAARTTLEDRAQWKDVIVHSKDILPQASCVRSSSSQIALATANQFPDLLDLPRQQGHDLQSQNSSFPLHMLNPSYCTIPRGRSKHHGDTGNISSSAVNVQGDVAQSSFSQPHNSEYRSSSALNLALSEAASLAYAQGGHPLLTGSNTGLDSHDPLALQQMIASQSCNGSNRGPGCDQLTNGGQDPYRFEYHAAQLEKFLQEYRSLQQQLLVMKQSYQAQHRTGSTPRLDCCGDNHLSPSTAGVIQPTTTSSYPIHQACISLSQSSTNISQPFISPSDMETATAFISPQQSSVHYSVPDAGHLTTGQEHYPSTSQCYAMNTQSYSNSPQSYTDPSVSFSSLDAAHSYSSPSVPYVPPLTQCHPASAHSYTVPLQICTTGDMDGGVGAGDLEGSPNPCHSSPLCSETSSVSPPTVTFPPGNEHAKPTTLNKGARPTEPLKSILKKTSSSSSSEPGDKIPPSRNHHQQHKPNHLRKQQNNSHWKS